MRVRLTVTLVGLAAGVAGGVAAPVPKVPSLHYPTWVGDRSVYRPVVPGGGPVVTVTDLVINVTITNKSITVTVQELVSFTAGR